jgi:peptidyl-prolyl cis-trans isomerase SurA
LAAVLALAGAARGDIIDRIAVSVGTRVITSSDLDREIRVAAFLNGAKPDLSPAARRATAERMVEQKLIRRELETSRYPAPEPGEVEAPLREFKKQFAGEDEYVRVLAANGIAAQDVKDELLWQRTLLLFIEVRFRPGVQVSDPEIQDYFDKVVAPAAKAAHPGQPVALEDYRNQIEKKLAGERVDQDMDTWLKQARRRTGVVYHEEAFQ